MDFSNNRIDTQRRTAVYVRISTSMQKTDRQVEEIELRAPIFSDCTGDGTIGFLAGADWMMGREGRDEFGEKLAPEKGDKLTMGASVQWYSVKGEGKSSSPRAQGSYEERDR